MHPADEQRGVPAAGTPELILHHYDRSPFSGKIRLIFGLKGLAWRSVIHFPKLGYEIMELPA